MKTGGGAGRGEVGKNGDLGSTPRGKEGDLFDALQESKLNILFKGFSLNSLSGYVSLNVTVWRWVPCSPGTYLGLVAMVWKA